MKRYELKPDGDALRLPAEILPHLAAMDAAELKTLLLLAAGRTDPAEAGLTPEEYRGALGFLRGAGLAVDAAPAPKTENPTAPDDPDRRPPASRPDKDAVPEFRSAEISAMLKDNILLASLLDACQRTVGKTFTPTEANAVLAMHETLGLDGEYILLLLAHCAERDKKNMTYALRMATGLTERGIDTASALEAEFEREAALRSAEGMLRRLFGIGDRALTKKETEIFTRWTSGRQHSEELIREAYDITVAKAGKASIPYCDTILEDWFAKGIKTPDEAKAAQGKKKPLDRGSFDTDDFFEAALKHSMKNVGK